MNIAAIQILEALKKPLGCRVGFEDPERGKRQAWNAAVDACISALSDSEANEDLPPRRSWISTMYPSIESELKEQRFRRIGWAIMHMNFWERLWWSLTGSHKYMTHQFWDNLMKESGQRDRSD